MILQTEHLSKSYGGRTLFHDVTFRLEEYDRLALVGPNGAGKTTLLNIISGEDDPDEGRVLFAKGARVGYLEQEAIEMGDLPVFEEVISSQTEVLEAEQRLHKLEAELGCTLLVRSSHGVRLSEEGEHLLPYINQVISACDGCCSASASPSAT